MSVIRTNDLVGTCPRSITTSDFDADGNADLAVANQISNDITILLGTGTGSFNVAGNIPIGNSGVSSLIASDFNGDGATDLAEGTQSSIFLNCRLSQITDLSKEIILSVYPNPANGLVFVHTNKADKITADLYDSNGRHVFSKILNNKSNIDVTTLDNGIYILVVKASDQVANKKLTVLH